MSDNYENKNIDSGAEQNAEPPIESQIVKKKSLSRKIADVLMSEDYKMIFKSIYDNIVSPAIKKVAVEAFRSFVYRGKTSSGSFDDYTDYGSFSDGGSSRGSESRVKPSIGEIMFTSEDSAARCLNIMRNKLRKESIILVADYYKIAGQTPSHTHYDYGWANLNSAYIYHYSNKGERVWGIHLPEPMPIDRRP